MVITGARKRLESIERDVIPSLFVGVLAKDESWLRHTLEDTLPTLEAKALRLALECKEKGECSGEETLCDEARIRALFKEIRSKLEKEHHVRKARTRFGH